MFTGGERSSSDYVASHKHAFLNTEDNVDEDSNYKPVTVAFYDIVTDFYQWGWGQSFHFAPRNKGEGFHESLLRQEHWLAGRLGIKPGEDVCDLGCGVCGPLVNIAKFTRANIAGVTIDEYQVTKGNGWIKKNNLHNRCKAVQGDFHELPFPSNSFDKGYDMEATAHSTRLKQFFSEVHRVLRDGGEFAGYAWVSTEKYNPNDPKEREILEGLAYGNAISVLHSFKDYVEAIEAVPGLELVEEYDANKLGDDFEWYDPLLPKMTPDGLLATKTGRALTAQMTRVLEFIGLAPAGAYQTTQVLEIAARTLVEAGKRGIYTPIHYYKVRKVPGSALN